MDSVEQRDLADYFLHHQCGYTFDTEGRAGNLTNQEVQRLFHGYNLWQEHIENADAEEKKPGQRATKGDHDAFDQFAADVNNRQKVT